MKHDKKNQGKTLDDFEEFESFRILFSKIPREDLVNGWEIDYSDESLEKLADRLGSVYMCLEVEERADYPDDQANTPKELDNTSYGGRNDRLHNKQVKSRRFPLG